MKKIFTAILLFSVTILCSAQQATQYSMYMLNKHAFNPAYAGMENSLSLTGVYRSQWLNLPGSPETQAVNAHMPLYIANGGIGINLENETLGSWTQTTTLLSYNYQKLLGRSGVLSIGGSLGFIQRKFDGQLARTPEGIFDDNGNYLGHNEESLPFSIESGNAPTFNFGAFYQGEKLEIGISAVNLLQNQISLSTISFEPERSYYLYIGYRYDISKQLILEPSVLLKSDVHQTQIDFSIIGRYNENIFAGASFRGYGSESRDALVLIGGTKVSEKITIGYSYDLTLSGLSSVSSGTHELFLNYFLGKQIGKGKPPIIIYNPRSL